MSAPSFQYNLISILGENVALTPTGLAPSETTIVEFDRYYIPPDISGNEALLLKNTMREVFQNKLKKVDQAHCLYSLLKMFPLKSFPLKVRYVND
jgi:hypothetical protein